MEKDLHVPRRMAMKLIVCLSVWMPWVDAGCTCKYFDAGGSDCSCGEWTREWWGGDTCTSGGDGVWRDCDEKTNQGDCESATNAFGQEFCKWETRDETCDAVRQDLATARKDLEAALAALAHHDGANVAKYSTAAERGECLAADGGSCDKCCQGITGTCKKLTVDGKGNGMYFDTTLDDKDDCVLVEANYNIVHVNFPRLKLPRLFFSSACRVGRRRRRRDRRQARRLQLPPCQHLPRPSGSSSARVGASRTRRAATAKTRSSSHTDG